MVQTIKISREEKDFINDLLNLSGDEIYQKYGYKRDETIIHTAKFSNGIEADIKLVISEEESPYTEGVLFHDGYELTRTDPDDVYDGEWDFEFNGLKYIVFVETEKWWNNDFLIRFAIELLLFSKNIIFIRKKSQKWGFFSYKNSIFYTSYIMYKTGRDIFDIKTKSAS